MSNEEMVAAIQGGDTALLEPLWNQVRRLVHAFAYRHHRATQGRGGVTVEDLVQVGYLAMVDAIPRYDPEEAAFATFLVQYLRKHFQEASGRLYKDTHGNMMPKDALDTSLSLNVTVDEDEETELMEITADPATDWESIEDVIWRDQLRQAMESVLSELPEGQSAVLKCRYYDRKTLASTGKQLDMPPEEVRKQEGQGLKALRQHKLSQKIRPFYDFDYYRGSSLGAFRSSGMSVQEQFLVQKEKKQHHTKRQRI